MQDDINLPPMPPMRVLRTVMPDDHRYGHVHGFARRDLVQYARAAVVADREERQQCTWTPDDEGVWSTDCGECHIINDGTPAENSMRHCCYCGGRLIQAGAQRAREDSNG